MLAQRFANDLQNEADPEDGISPEVDIKLRDRRTGTSVTTWDSLWKALFGDENPKSEGE